MTVYLDTSSLVKLFLEESGSDQVRALVADATALATSVVAYAETRAALARRRRERILTPRAFSTAKRTFEGQWPKFVSIEVTADVARQAGDLAERHGLRGFDSVHLASFVSLADQAAPRCPVLQLRQRLEPCGGQVAPTARRASVSRRRLRS